MPQDLCPAAGAKAHASGTTAYLCTNYRKKKTIPAKPSSLHAANIMTHYTILRICPGMFGTQLPKTYAAMGSVKKNTKREPKKQKLTKPSLASKKQRCQPRSSIREFRTDETWTDKCRQAMFRLLYAP
jgi:hypothetical protein